MRYIVSCLCEHCKLLILRPTPAPDCLSLLCLGKRKGRREGLPILPDHLLNFFDFFDVSPSAQLSGVPGMNVAPVMNRFMNAV